MGLIEFAILGRLGDGGAGLGQLAFGLPPSLPRPSIAAVSTRA
jgi:hypothetical protein